jgi:hypothetical protein
MAIPTLPSRAISLVWAVHGFLLAALVLGVATAPALAAPCAGFTDLDDSSEFCVNVTWMKNRGVTLGCTPTQYCPNADVTRLQMAAFMNRLGDVTFQQGGNAYGATAVLGTTDNQSVDIHANGRRVMRYDPAPVTPNLIGGYEQNAVTPGAVGQTISGGGASGTWCPGWNGLRDCKNAASFDYATVGGGISNHAQGVNATIAGGFGNLADGTSSIVAGGQANRAKGVYAAIPGGYKNKAYGRASFVAGYEGTAVEDGMFVWSDSRQFEFDPALYRAPGQSEDTFNVRATGVGGVWFVTGINGATGVPTWACYAQNGSGWTCASDRNLKRNLQRLDGQAILAKLGAMPIYQWQPKDGPNAEIKHYGPMAQDFYAAFGLGDSDKAIGFQDADGVALAAIQGLHALAQRQAQAIEALRAELAAQRNALAEFRLALARVGGRDADVLRARSDGTTRTRWSRKVTLREPETGDVQ